MIGYYGHLRPGTKPNTNSNSNQKHIKNIRRKYRIWGNYAHNLGIIALTVRSWFQFTRWIARCHSPVIIHHHFYPGECRGCIESQIKPHPTCLNCPPNPINLEPPYLSVSVSAVSVSVSRRFRIHRIRIRMIIRIRICRIRISPYPYLPYPYLPYPYP